MSAITKNVTAVIAGLVGGFLVVAGVEWLLAKAWGPRRESQNET